MSQPDEAAARATAAGSALVGKPIDAIEQVGGGRNSRVFRLQADGQAFALKQYPSRADDPRDRLATEVGALRLMAHYSIDEVPRIIGVDAGGGFALLSWIEGVPVDAVSATDVEAAVAFLAKIHVLRDVPWAAEQPLAAEACLSGAEIERQIEVRLTNLRVASPGEHELIDFIDNSFAAAFAARRACSQREIAAARLDFASDLPQKWRSLVPSDFGFHNSLRRKDGSLAFLDFEYFGWDDPVKLTADILLHPGRSLSAPRRRQFRRAAAGIYGADKDFGTRLSAFLPLFALRWSLILLNEFIPERWQRRVAAGTADDWSAAKARQLGLARRYVALASEGVGD